MANILIVDDARVMRFHISKLFKELGHNIVAEAKDGQEALELYEQHKPDLVTMDIEMPPAGEVKGGIDALEKILKLNPEAIVIMISSQSDKDNIAIALKRGAKNFLRKPITGDSLRELLAQMGINA